MDRFRYAILHCVGFLDLLAVSLIIPALPVHLKSLGASATLSGFISSVYGSLQLFSSPLVGKWSDENGRLNIMKACLALSGIGYLFSSYVSVSLVGLTLLRILPGVFKHTQDLCRCSLIEECAGSKNQALGSFNAVASIGFIIGPTVHGHLVETFGQAKGVSLSFVICSVLFALNFVTVVVLQSRSSFRAKKAKIEDKVESRCNGNAPNGHQTRPTEPGFSTDVTRFQRGVLMSRFLTALSVMVFRSSFVLWLTHYNPGLSPSIVGYILSYNGFLGLAFGFLVGTVSGLRCYAGREEKLQIHACCMLLISFGIVLISNRIIFVLIALTTLVMGTAVLRVCGLVLTVKYVENDELGKVQGLGSSVLSVARFSSSLIAGVLQDVSFSAPNICSFSLVALGIAVFYRNCYPRVKKEDKDK